MSKQQEFDLVNRLSQAKRSDRSQSPKLGESSANSTFHPQINRNSDKLLKSNPSAAFKFVNQQTVSNDLYKDEVRNRLKVEMEKKREELEL